MDILIKFKIEDIKLEKTTDNTYTIKLPELSEQEKFLIDPIVAPTSGLRIQIYDVIEENRQYLLTNKK